MCEGEKPAKMEQPGADEEWERDFKEMNVVSRLGEELREDRRKKGAS